jgi:hypothetical protein
MRNRSIAGVIILTIVTFGIYGLYWRVSTKGEMVALGADIPTAWLIIVPIANLWWLWKWCVGVEKVTNGKLSGPVAFLLGFLHFIGIAIIQDALNKSATPLPQARVA